MDKRMIKYFCYFQQHMDDEGSCLDHQINFLKSTTPPKNFLEFFFLKMTDLLFCILNISSLEF